MIEELSRYSYLPFVICCAALPIAHQECIKYRNVTQAPVRAVQLVLRLCSQRSIKGAAASKIPSNRLTFESLSLESLQSRVESRECLTTSCTTSACEAARSSFASCFTRPACPSRTTASKLKTGPL